MKYHNSNLWYLKSDGNEKSEIETFYFRRMWETAAIAGLAAATKLESISSG